MNNLMIFIPLLILLPTYIATMFVPYWTRRTESFGVSIPEEKYNSAELKQLRKNYLVIMSIVALAVTIIFIVASIGKSEEVITTIMTIVIITYLLFSFIIYLRFHQKMKKLKATANWQQDGKEKIIVSTSFRNEKLIYSNMWFSFSFIITIGIIIYTLRNYALLPDQIPMQYNFFGEVTNWAEKSYRSALMLPVMQLFLTLMFLFLNATIQRAKQQINKPSPLDLKRNAIFRRRWSLFLIIAGNSIVGLLALIQLSFFHPIDQSTMMFISLLFSLGLLAYAIILSFTTGQGGSRVAIVDDEEEKMINRDDDRYWKLGIFYFNREDPALFLEKRFGVGWTINLARPLAWTIFLLIIGLAILIPILFS